MAIFHLVSPRHFESWGPGSPDSPGIGGSETMHCEMAWRLAEAGHTVISYAPIAPKGAGLHRGVLWRHVDALDPTRPGIWVLIRALEWVPRFLGPPTQRLWCVMQDQDHPGAWPSAWGAKLEKVIGLCEAHVEELTRRHPAFADTIVRSRNGLREDLIARMLPQAGPRQPHRLMYASSPDRGLLGLLEVFRTIRFHCRTAELHVYYGFDNMATLTSPRVRTQMQRILARAAQPGVFMHGRTGQPALYQAWLESALYVHPTNFLETGHIALMEAQALGAIPVVNPQWATGEQLLAGIAIEGDGEGDRLQLRRYAHAALYLLQHPELQEEMRASMMAEARKRFGWTGVVEQYDAWAKEGA